MCCFVQSIGIEIDSSSDVYGRLNHFDLVPWFVSVSSACVLNIKVFERFQY